jgi:hypothetical protein
MGLLKMNENWNNGAMEEEIGTMEYWNNGKNQR